MIVFIKKEKRGVFLRKVSVVEGFESDCGCFEVVFGKGDL